MRKLLLLFLVVTLICLFHTAMADEGFLRIESFSEGLAAVQNMERRWGYIDKTGTLVIPCEWEEAKEFKDGIARIKKDDKYGWINTSGQLVINCEWKECATFFSEGLAAVKNDEGLWGFIDTTGTVTIPFRWDGPLVPKFSEGLAAVNKGDAMGFISKAGEEVIPCQYKFCNSFSHGYALVQDNSGLFFIDTTGTDAFPEFPHTDLADSFREDGIAYIGFEDHTGCFIDTDGIVRNCRKIICYSY